MDLKNDPRIMDQEDYLMNAHLRHSGYVPPREGWDHDHCEFCSLTISASTGKAYCTEDYRWWICEECYNDFKEAFEWALVNEPVSEVGGK